MAEMTDFELIEEIRKRFEFNRNALQELRVLTKKLEQMNEKLQDSEAVKSHFLSNIRNEIINPLSAIMGLASQGSSGGGDELAWQKSAAMIYSEAFNLDFQLQNIFMTAELEAGEAEPDFSKTDVVAIVTSCLEKLSPYIDEKALNFELVLPEQAVFVTDAKKFELIVLNLLSNAFEFNEIQGKVILTVQVDTEQGLRIVIEDNGPGIDLDDQEVVFDRFKQLDVGTTKTHRGHGLGLSLCRALAELLGGSLSLQSGLSQGTVVTVLLPYCDQHVETVATEGNMFLFESSDDTEVF